MVNPIALSYAKLKQFHNNPQYNPGMEAVYNRAMSAPVAPNIGGEIIRNVLGAYVGSKLGEGKQNYMAAQQEQERQKRLADERSMLDYRVGLEDKQKEAERERLYQGLLGMGSPESFSPTGEQWASPAPVKGVPAGAQPELYNKMMESKLGLLPVAKNEWTLNDQGYLLNKDTSEWKRIPNYESKPTTEDKQGYTIENPTTKETRYITLKSGENIPKGWGIRQIPQRASIRQLGLNLGGMSTSELLAIKKNMDDNSLMNPDDNNSIDNAQLVQDELSRRVQGGNTSTSGKYKPIEGITKGDLWREVSSSGNAVAGKEFLMKTYGYSSDTADNIIDEGIVKGYIK